MSKFKSLVRVIALLTLVVGISTGAVAQSGRSLKTKVTPTFPELAKRMNVAGAVKVEVTVLPNGSVKTAKAIGGHPLLIDAAEKAARQFKYEAGEETKELVEFKFNAAGSNN
ncbi:MAG: energy transducer TonB [Terriglobales bacterium]